MAEKNYHCFSTESWATMEMLLCLTPARTTLLLLLTSIARKGDLNLRAHSHILRSIVIIITEKKVCIFGSILAKAF
jgi:hypothetical protein